VKLFGLLGYPVKHSVSPAMMNAAFVAIGMEGTYLPFEIEPSKLGDALKGLMALGAAGVNVTIPHKEAVQEFVQELTPAAKMVGAVNTIKFDETRQRMIGHNTDASGWWRSVQHRCPERIKQVTVLGAGGAARAVIAALGQYATVSTVKLVARRREQAEVIQRHFGNLMAIEIVEWTERHSAVYDAELVVNTTPIGMWPHQNESPIEDAACFHPMQVVQDVVYRPLETQFMRQASAAGATVVDGLQMLVYQGAEALEFWTGRTPPVDVMSAAAKQALVGTA
jgi:shikimate dehydrogenase